MDPSENWQTCLHTVVERGDYLLKSGECTDCKFIVGQEQQEVIEAHKIFLVMSSPVFKAMFYGPIAEQTDPILIDDIQPEVFKIFLKYIYTDKVELGSIESARELLYCSKKYMLPYLSKQCTEYLSAHLSPENVCNIYEMSEVFREATLNKNCLNMISTRTLEVLSSASWEKVKLDTLLTIFDLDNLKINTEMDLLAAADRWAKAECKKKSLNPLDTTSLKSVIGDALSKIRLLTLTSRQFAKEIYNSSLLTNDEILAVFMNICSDKSPISMPEGFSIFLDRRCASNSVRCSKCGTQFYFIYNY